MSMNIYTLIDFLETTSDISAQTKKLLLAALPKNITITPPPALVSAPNATKQITPRKSPAPRICTPLYSKDTSKPCGKCESEMGRCKYYAFWDGDLFHMECIGDQINQSNLTNDSKKNYNDYLSSNNTGFNSAVANQEVEQRAKLAEMDDDSEEEEYFPKSF